MKTFEAVPYKGPKGTWVVHPGLCKGCGLCVEKCPTKVIKWSKEMGAYGTPRVECNADGCIACEICVQVCPDSALAVEKHTKK